MSLLHPLPLRSLAPARQALWRLVTGVWLLAALAQPGLAPAQAAPAPRAPQAAVAPRLGPLCSLLVINTNDTGPGSLRQAVACATAGQTVIFSNTLASATILLSGQISITVPLSVDGSGAPGVKLDGGGASRIFNIFAGGPVTLTALVLQHGSAAGTGGAVLADDASPLLLNQVDVLSSTATTFGGGLYASAAVTLNGGRFQGNSCPNVSCYAGGLFADTTLALTGTQFIGNDSTAGGGGAYALDVVTLNGGLFQSNACTGDGCIGGGLYAEIPLALTGTEFLSNTSRSIGGAVDAASGGTLTNGLFEGNRCTEAICNGGGLYSDGSLVMTGTNFISNTSTADGGGVDAADAVTVTGGSFQRNLCNEAGCYGGGLNADTSLVVTGTQFISNTSQGAGGGTYADTAVVTNAWFQGNGCSPEFCVGGGLAAGTIVTVTGSTFISNTADTFGGGLFTFNRARVTGSTFTGNTCLNGSCEGAGLSSQGPGLVFSSTFNGNHANSAGGGLSGRSTLTVVNSTVSGNTADQFGGGILAGDGGTLRLLNVTVANNTAAVLGGGLYAYDTSTVGVTNTIFANNGDKTCTGPIAAGSHNLEWPGTTCATAGPTAGFTSADALLGLLALNAPGTTMTRALLPASPARDAGDAATCAGPEVNNRDQRGVTRPIDGDAVPGAICDIGAYEASALPPPVFMLYLPLVRR